MKNYTQRWERKEGRCMRLLIFRILFECKRYPNARVDKNLYHVTKSLTNCIVWTLMIRLTAHIIWIILDFSESICFYFYFREIFCQINLKIPFERENQFNGEHTNVLNDQHYCYYYGVFFQSIFILCKWIYLQPLTSIHTSKMWFVRCTPIQNRLNEIKNP